MKKEIKIWLLAFFMCIATVLNIGIAFGCIFSTLNHFGITTRQPRFAWNLPEALCFLIVSGYGIIMTILYLKHK
jgi:hypothetical protein